MLSDLLSDPRAVPFFLEWRSPADRATSLPALLLGVWTEVDAARGVSDATGLLASTAAPLAGVKQAAEGGGGGGGSLEAGTAPGHLAASAAAAAARSGGGGGKGSATLLAAGGGGSTLLASGGGGSTLLASGGSAAYGYLRPERRRLLEQIAAASDGNALMDKVCLLWWLLKLFSHLMLFFSHGLEFVGGRAGYHLRCAGRFQCYNVATLHRLTSPPFPSQVHACLSPAGFDAVTPLLTPRQLASPPHPLTQPPTHALDPTSQVHACLSQAGFDAVAPLLAPRQLASFALVRQYVKLRQGEVWRGIAEVFEAEGLQPSAEDR